MREPYSNELYHHGILGQKWGVRRYQNPDGSLTKAGSLRYYKDSDGKYKKHSKEEVQKNIATERTKIQDELLKKHNDEYEKSDYAKAEKEYFKKHPDADLDDFDDYIADNPEIKRFKPKDDYSGDSAKLEKHYSTAMTAGAGLVSALYLAPAAALITNSITKSNKKAALAFVGTVATMSAATYIHTSSEHKKTEKKYGLR